MFTDDEWRTISQTQVLLSRYVLQQNVDPLQCSEAKSCSRVVMDSAQRDGMQCDRYEVLCQVLKEESRVGYWELLKKSCNYHLLSDTTGLSEAPG